MSQAEAQESERVEHTASMRDLQRRAAAVIARVTAGEIVVITSNGEPLAKLVPMDGEPAGTKE